MDFSLDAAQETRTASDNLPWRISNNLQAWYLVSASSEIREGAVKSAQVGNSEVVLWRSNGQIRALDPHCSHMGAKLCHGKVDCGHLVCPLHGWRYEGSGRVAGGKTGIRSWPAVETQGGVLVFNGRKPLFAPPQHQKQYRWGGVSSHLIDAPWFALTANAFDTHHYEAVHRRRLLEPPQLKQLDEYRFQCSYRSEVTGHHLSDKVMQRLAPDGIKVTMTCFGGPLFTVTSTLSKHTASLMVGMEPVGDKTRLRLLVGSKGGPFRAILARYLYTSFLKSDLIPMTGIKLSPFTGLKVDETMERFARYLETLPEAPR